MDRGIPRSSGRLDLSLHMEVSQYFPNRSGLSIVGCLNSLPELQSAIAKVQSAIELRRDRLIT